MPIEIEEVLRRTEQGVTMPYICRGTDGKLYYVKGKNAGYESLVKEWIAGALARHMGLPIAPFDFVFVPVELYELGRHVNQGGLNLAGLGSGTLFGSEHIPDSNELSFLNVTAIPIALKRDIAAFDWWIMNGDRTLTESGGNPNILWSERNKTAVIIDHNLAFDPSVTLNSQLSDHVFAGALAEICEDPELQSRYGIRFTQVMSELPNIIGDIPPRWHYVDDQETVEISLSTATVEAALQRFMMPDFWKRT
ncbi:HipA family kinase [Pseudorhizobium pelagicum]|uniref:HipA-like kinase domain-containing protein n=1 Tax=Pseudorhizobium pelagicum TaxID=1509405 RepID=A0A922P1V2_9HYPH|nr:HipA family kinase [Pseudorhizobium pelagicum]KEQ09327.1 hypothetical protein GV67_01215 [Pseudorhizobium pelagicum]KEQ10852.1 hypothetical protein GV68_00830 [Pseudorhizobium pelagicum]